MKNARMGQKIQKDQKKYNPIEKNEKTVEVLYQKMGDRWFAFSLIGDEVFVGSVSQHEIDSGSASKKKKIHSITGNS